MQTNINGVKYKKIYIRKKPTDDYVLYKKAYVDGVQTYSAGNPVTYYVDSDTTYTEEVEFEASCLSPATFTPAKDGWTFVGWREDATASGDVLTEKVMGDNPITLYAVFKQDITLSYNGNGATSGSTASQSETRYYNNGNVVNPSFTLKANGFARSGYTFTKWDAGTVGTNITLTSNRTVYAQWKTAVVLSAGKWQAATSVSNGSMAYNSGGYLKHSTRVNDGSASYTGPSFTVDTTGIKTVSLTVYLGGINAIDGAGWCEIAFTINGKTVKCTHYTDQDEYTAISRTLTIDVSAMSGAARCTSSLRYGCRSEEDDSGWYVDAEIRVINITAS